MTLAVPSLGIPGLTVLESGRDDRGLWYRAEVDAAGPPVCPSCGGPALANGSRPQTMRDHVPGHGPATIRFARPRRRCLGGCGVISVPIPGRSPRRPAFTARLVDLVVDRLRAGLSALDVAEDTGLGRATVAEIAADAGVQLRRAGRPRKTPDPA